MTFARMQVHLSRFSRLVPRDEFCCPSQKTTRIRDNESPPSINKSYGARCVNEASNRHRRAGCEIAGRCHCYKMEYLRILGWPIVSELSLSATSLATRNPVCSHFRLLHDNIKHSPRTHFNGYNSIMSDYDNAR